MNILPLVSLALAACQAPVSASAPDQGEVEVRVYDLSSLTSRSSTEELEERGYPAFAAYDEEKISSQALLELNEALPAAVLRMLLDPDFENEGHSIEHLGAGRFVIAGPAALHERVGRALAQIVPAFTERIELEVDFVRLDAPLPGAASVVPEAEVRPRIEAAEREGRLQRLRLSLATGVPEMVVIGRRVDLVADYDMEIAMGSFMADPRVVRVDLGTRLAVRAAPGEGGVFLALVARRADPAGEIRERRLRLAGRLGSEQERASVESEDLLHQGLEILNRSLALNTFLPDGRALVLLTSQGRASAHEAVVIRKLGGGLSRSMRLQAEGRSSGLLQIDCSAWSPPCVAAELFDPRRVEREPPDTITVLRGLPNQINSALRASFRLKPYPDAAPDLMALMTSLAPGSGALFESWEGGWPRAVLRVPPGRTPAELEAGLRPFAPEQRVVQVSLSLRSSAGAPALASLQLPLRLGVRSAAVLGVEDLIVFDADVEVAQHSGVEDPHLGALFDGLVVSVEPRLGLDGSLTLVLKGLAAAREGDVRRLELAPSGAGELEQATQRFLSLGQELRFAPGNAPQRAVIGDLAGGLALEVEVRF